MRLRKSLVAFATSVAAVTTLVGLAAPEASAQSLPGTITVSNGTEIFYNDQIPQPYAQGSWCTLGAVGTDRLGRNVGITAGHCNSYLQDPLDEVNITDDSRPIYDRDNLNWREGGNEHGNDPIGYQRWFKDPDGASGGHSSRDYSVIEFVDGVKLSSQGPLLKMTGISEGTIASPHATAPALPQEKVLSAFFTNFQLIHASVQTGTWYGRIAGNTAGGAIGTTGPLGVYQADAKIQAGDSGGPAIIKDANTPYPSAANGFTASGKWVGIVRAKVFSNPVYTFTSSANILADLRTRDLASGQDGSVVGAGFQVTTNP